MMIEVSRAAGPGLKLLRGFPAESCPVPRTNLSSLVSAVAARRRALEIVKVGERLT